MAETNLSWPGERDPTRLDVEDAHKVPEPTFLRDFKQALIAKDIARDYQHVSSSGSAGQLSRSPIATSGHLNDGYESRQFTYPLTLLSNFPDIPDSEELGTLESFFRALSKKFIFLRAISMPGSSRELLPPYLRLSLACFASCLSPSPESFATVSERIPVVQSDVGKALFSAGVKVWGVMLEVDNREARKVESVMASVLLATYGSLSADAKLWPETSVLVGYTGPIVRRLHMHDFCAQFDEASWRSKSRTSTRTRSLLMSYQFLIDVVHAVHYNTSTQYNSSELFITMPASNHNFHDVYTKLVLEEHPLPLNMTEEEDAVLILSALLSDIITIHKVFSGFDLQSAELLSSQPSTSSNTLSVLNPFVPFSPFAENQRMLSQILKSLDLWGKRFRPIMSEDVLSLFYFCDMCLSFPQALLLPQLAEYEPAVISSSGSRSELDLASVVISEAAIRSAWLVVDHVNVGRLPDRAACPVWLPVVTYIAALVVWAKLKSSSMSRSTYGTLKVLGMFKAELQQMPWPCCTEMVKNLDELMRARG